MLTSSPLLIPIDAANAGGSAVNQSTSISPPTEPATPFVSVVLPCRDEERHIRKALATILDGDWPRDRLEVLVIDGRSRDRTRLVVSSVAAADDRVRLLDNPRGTTPAALNIGVRAARGQIIVRADGHCAFPPNFISGQVRALVEGEADMVGVSPDNTPGDDTVMARAIAASLDSPFATGSPFRFRKKSGPTDAAGFGCWRRELFDRIGFFDERLLRNQDNEHSARIRAAGGRVHLCSDVRVSYVPRSTLKSFMQQGSQNGTWNTFTQKLHPHSFRWRHVLPVVFFAGVVLSAALVVAGLFTDWRLSVLGALLVAPYVFGNLVATMALAVGSGLSRAVLIRIPAVFAGFHFAYGYGIARGWMLVATGRWRTRLGQ